MDAMASEASRASDRALLVGLSLLLFFSAVAGGPPVSTPSDMPPPPMIIVPRMAEEGPASRPPKSLAWELGMPAEFVETIRVASAMHDVTEGGILGAAWEMAYVGRCGVRLNLSAIPVLPCTRAICDALKIDPLRLVSSGSMLIACTDGSALVSALAAAGISAACIGRAEGEGLTDAFGTPIAPPEADEIYRLSLVE